MTNRTALDVFVEIEQHIENNTEDGNYLIDSNHQDSELMIAVLSELIVAFVSWKADLNNGIETEISACHKMLFGMLRKNSGVELD